MSENEEFEDENVNKFEAESDEYENTYENTDIGTTTNVFWLKHETLKLLKLYHEYEDMFNSFGKRKHAWSLISATLESMGIIKDRKQCATKWNNLLRTYKQVKKCGRRPIKFEYFNQMNEILGSKKVVLEEETQEMPTCSSSTKRKIKIDLPNINNTLLLPDVEREENLLDIRNNHKKIKLQKDINDINEMPLVINTVQNHHIETNQINKSVLVNDVDHFAIYISKLLTSLPEFARGELEIKFLSLIYEKKREISNIKT